MASARDSGPQRSVTEEALLAVLIAARGKFTITRTKVAKLLYLADLEMVRSVGRTASGATWRWLHHGPYDLALLHAEEELQASNLISVTQTENWYGSPEFRLSAVEDATSRVDQRFWEIVSAMVEEHAAKAASTLRDLTYQTTPMLEAQADGRRGVVLDLDAERPVPSIAPALRSLREALGRLPRQTTDDGVHEDVASQIEALSDARRLANSEMLD